MPLSRWGRCWNRGAFIKNKTPGKCLSEKGREVAESTQDKDKGSSGRTSFFPQAEPVNFHLLLGAARRNLTDVAGKTT